MEGILLITITFTTTATANNMPINQESLQFDCWYKIWKLKVSQLKESVFENRVSRGLSIEQGSPRQKFLVKISPWWQPGTILNGRPFPGAAEYSPNELGTVDYDCGQILKLSYKRSASSWESLKSSFFTLGQLSIRTRWQRIGRS